MANFDLAIKEVLNNEGGYINDRYDPGGETKFGISKKAYPHIDIKHLTIDQAKELYFTDYWLKNRYGELISQKIAEQIFDLAVNIGSNPANKIAQSAFNFLSFCLFNYAHNILQLTVDGLIGEKTIAALNTVRGEGENALLLIVVERLAAEKYSKFKQPRYIHGWLKRLFENADLKMVALIGWQKKVPLSEQLNIPKSLLNRIWYAIKSAFGVDNGD